MPLPGRLNTAPYFAAMVWRKKLVLGFLVVDLDHVVVDVLDDQGDLDPIHAELLELHPRHGPGGAWSRTWSIR
jgi:hypothetical protein